MAHSLLVRSRNGSARRGNLSWSHPHPTILEATEKRKMQSKQPSVWWWRRRKTAETFTWRCSTIGILLLKAWTQVRYKGSWVAALRPYYLQPPNCYSRRSQTDNTRKCWPTKNDRRNTTIVEPEHFQIWSQATQWECIMAPAKQRARNCWKPWSTLNWDQGRMKSSPKMDEICEEIEYISESPRRSFSPTAKPLQRPTKTPHHSQPAQSRIHSQFQHRHQRPVICQQWPTATPKAIRSLSLHRNKAVPVSVIRRTKYLPPDRVHQWRNPDI